MEVTNCRSKINVAVPRKIKIRLAAVDPPRYDLSLDICRLDHDEALKDLCIGSLAEAVLDST